MFAITLLCTTYARNVWKKYIIYIYDVASGLVAIFSLQVDLIKKEATS